MKVIEIKFEDGCLSYKQRPGPINAWDFMTLIEGVLKEGYVLKKEHSWQWFAPSRITSVRCEWD